MIKIFVFLAVIFVSGYGHAQELPTPEQRNVMKHVANAMVLDIACKTLSVDSGVAAFLALGYGMTAEDFVMPGGKFTPVFMELMADAAKVVADASKTTAEFACISGGYLYGYKGQNVPGLLK